MGLIMAEMVTGEKLIQIENVYDTILFQASGKPIKLPEEIRRSEFAPIIEVPAAAFVGRALLNESDMLVVSVDDLQALLLAADREHALRERSGALLGPHVLTGKGDELVGVSSERLWCDVVAFEEGIEGGRLEEALELYGGPLLDGFHLPEAPAFERWLEAERRRIRLRAVEAAWQHVERKEAAADTRSARRWAERALAWADQGIGPAPHLLHWQHARALEATGAREAAGTHAARAHEALSRSARTLSDPRLIEAFLDLPSHRAIRAASSEPRRRAKGAFT